MQEGHLPPAVEPMLDLRGYLTVLRRRKWSILFITAVAVASALAFSFQQTPIYESTAKVQVNPPTTDPLQDLPITTLVNMDTEKQIAESTAVAEKAAAALGTTEPPEELLEDLSVSVPTNSLVLEITFADPDPGRAQAGAQAFAEAYLLYKVERAQATITRLTEAINKQIEGLNQDLDKAMDAFAAAEKGSQDANDARQTIDLIGSQIAALETQRAELRLITLNPGEIFSEADLPTEPASPNHVLNGGLALLLGLALGIGFAFLRERLDDRIAGREAFEEAIGGPTLAVVPRITAWRKRSRAELPALKAPKGAPAEAYRTVRTNLLFMAKDGEIKTVALTSPATGEGKTTTAANLAVSLAQTEKRVIVLSCDLRKPRLHEYFRLTNDIGVSSVVTGKATLSDAILKPVGAGTLRVIPSGPIPHNPAELLASDRMATMLGQLRRVADFVIIDTPPALGVSDTLTLAPMVDGVILIADAATTSRAAVRQLREQLEQVGGNILGGVFNNFDPSRAKAYASYGTYYGSYPYEPEDGKRRKKAPEPSGPAPEDVWRTEDIWR